MHIAQTKDESLMSGGPQYYLHDVPAHAKDFLRKHGARSVLLQTPYGIASTSFVAVGKDHKLAKSGKAIAGRVGHDRIQGKESIGNAIRHWYGLKGSRSFERIDLEAVIHDDGHFILVPTAVTMRGAKRPQKLEKINSPLSFHHDYESKLWRNQIEVLRNKCADDVSWAGKEIGQIVADHRKINARNIHEADLLRAAGALSVLGLNLSRYLCKGYDCPESFFNFSGFPPYPCPVEIKKRSARFDYQIMNYANLPRAVVLCIKHDFVNPPIHVDVVELSTLAKCLI